MKGLGFLKWRPNVANWFKGKNLLKKRPSKGQLLIGVGVLALIVFVVLSFVSGNTSTALYTIGLFAVVGAGWYFVSSRKGAEGDKPSGKSINKAKKEQGDSPKAKGVDDAKSFPIVPSLVLLVAAVMFIVSQILPPAGLLIDVLFLAVFGLLYYKGFRSPKDVVELCEWKAAFKTVGSKAKRFILALITFKWSPLTFHLEGSWIEFFFGWVPIVMKRSGVLIPVFRNPFSGGGIPLSWVRLEFIDIGLILYCFWTISDVLAMRASKESFTLYVYVSGFVINSTVLALSVLANRDGSRMRLGMYMLVGAVGLTNDVLMTQVFALDGRSGWLLPRYAVLANVDGSLFILVCGYAIFHELVFQPLSIGLSRRAAGLGNFSLPSLLPTSFLRRGAVDGHNDTSGNGDPTTVASAT